jgi:hypothetical protein
MSLVNKFRAYCPICSIQMRADRVLDHLKGHHPELDTADLNAISIFLANCAKFRLTDDIRLELNLADLTFRVLPHRTAVPQGMPPRSDGVSVEVPQDGALPPEAPLMKCSICGKLVFICNAVAHKRIHESNGPKSFPSLKLLPKYATASLPVGGWSVQGGAPGLGRRA